MPTIYVFETNKTNNVYPCKPPFYYIKMGFKGVKIIKACFRDEVQSSSTIHKSQEKELFIQNCRSNIITNFIYLALYNGGVYVSS